MGKSADHARGHCHGGRHQLQPHHPYVRHHHHGRGSAAADVTGFHIHRAPVGVNGPIIVDFTGVSPLVPVGTGFTFTAIGLTLPSVNERRPSWAAAPTSIFTPRPFRAAPSAVRSSPRATSIWRRVRRRARQYHRHRERDGQDRWRQPRGQLQRSNTMNGGGGVDWLGRAVRRRRPQW